MAGKEDGPSKANGVTKPLDKGKAKADDVQDERPDQEMKDKGGDEKDAKVLPPGTDAPVAAFVTLYVLTIVPRGAQ
jgi:hypothetical protein